MNHGGLLIGSCAISQTKTGCEFLNAIISDHSIGVPQNIRACQGAVNGGLNTYRPSKRLT